MESLSDETSAWVLFSRWLMRITAPECWLRERLGEMEVKPSETDFAAMDARLPWWEYQRLARCIKPLKSDDPIGRFGDFVDEERAYSDRRQIDIRDIYGICASKSHIVPLSRLSQTESVNNILANRDVKQLVREVLHGFVDYVAADGDPVRVVEQEWDGRLYVANSGGSHRFAAIWRWHREHDQPLMMDCIVSTARLSAATIEAVTKNRYWLLAPKLSWDLKLLLNMSGDRSIIVDPQRRDSGIYLRPLDHTGDSCIAYPRHHRFAAIMDEWLAGTPALDLSAAILRIAGRQERHSSVKPFGP